MSSTRTRNQESLQVTYSRLDFDPSTYEPKDKMFILRFETIYFQSSSFLKCLHYLLSGVRMLDFYFVHLLSLKQLLVACFEQHLMAYLRGIYEVSHLHPLERKEAR